MPALDGVKVLDFGRYVAGPFCAALLGDLGADVVRVERVGGGEDRFLTPVAGDGSGALFLLVNRNKRGVALDLSRPEAGEVVRRLLEWADVVVANLPRAGLASLGLDEPSVRAVNPDCVLATMDAFGSTGPYADRVGFDGVAQSMSGAVYLSGRPGSPTKSYVPWVDFATGTFAALGTVAALHSGVPGQRVEASLLRTALTVSAGPLIEQALTGANRESIGNRSHLAAPYDVCATRDGWVIVQVIGPAQFRRWCRLVGEPGWVDDQRFADDEARARHQEPLNERLASFCRARTTEEALALFDGARIPAGPVLAPQQVLDDPHVTESELFQTVPYGGLEVPLPVPPFTLAVGGPHIRRPAPGAGEHSRAVLAEAGLCASDIDRLVADGVVA